MASKVSPEVKDIELLKDECGGLMMEEGITTLTFYKGDFAAASAALRAQFVLVVAANPWLAGRLVKTKGGVRLRHPVDLGGDSGEIDALFTAASADDNSSAFRFAPASPYAKICIDMYASKQVIVGSGSSLVGKDKAVVLLTLTESTPGEFALVFSLSHAVADGRTYYEVFKMLGPGAAVRELATTRVMSFSESMKDTCGRTALEWVDSPSTACNFTFAFIPSMLGCGRKAKCYAFRLDAERLAAAKAAGASEGGVPYVSTNDILTSGFFTECESRIGMMGFDCREKVPGIGKDLAGNYVSALVLDRAVFGTPAALRKMLSSAPYETTGLPLPRGCCAFGSRDFAMVTNWSSFAGRMVALEGCELVIHLPVKNPAQIQYDLMIPFASGVGETGIICWTVSTDESGLRAALPVGECLSKELFP